MEPEKNILDHLAVLVRWRRLILISCFTVSLITAGISLLLTPVYRASAVLFPPRESQGSLGISALLDNLPMGLLGMGESGVSATEFVPILKSQRVAEAIVKRFNLKERYSAQTREELMLTVADRLDVELSREQFLNVSYEADTPELAAQITNAFVEELDHALRERREKQAGELRNYLEKRLAQAEVQMVEAEQAYNAFQNKNSAIDIESQAKAQIESFSALITTTLGELIIKREIAALQMEPTHPKLAQMDMEIAGVKEALDHILIGSTPTNGKPPVHSLPDIIIPMNQLPDLGLKALQLMREMEIRNVIYQFVLQEYEKTSFEEKKETSLVVVLDPAVPPDFRTRPRRSLMVATAAALSLLLSSLLAFLLEALQGLDPNNRNKLNTILQDLRLKRN